MGEGAGVADPCPLPHNPHPQPLKGISLAGAGGTQRFRLHQPLKRVGRGVWGEGRDFKSLALTPQQPSREGWWSFPAWCGSPGVGARGGLETGFS